MTECCGSLDQFDLPLAFDYLADDARKHPDYLAEAYETGKAFAQALET